eukprot:s595_g16.t1
MASPCNQKEEGSRQLYLLDGRNIACEGASFEQPNLQQLRCAQRWCEEHRPDWQVLTFVYQGLLRRWKQEYPGDVTREWERSLSVTPAREDVDKFIIRKAVDEQKRGSMVKIISNDNFSEYIGKVEDFRFDEAWIRRNVVKFCISAGDFIPADGVGDTFVRRCPKPMTTCDTAPRASPNGRNGSAGASAATAAPDRQSLPVRLTGRGAPSPLGGLQLEHGKSLQAKCPHRNMCPLRLDCKVDAGTWNVQITGYETPPGRAEKPVVWLSPARNHTKHRFFCPTCGKPLELLADSACAYVAVLFGPDKDVLQRFILGAMVLGFSLKKSGTRHDCVLLHTPDVLAAPGAGALEIYWKLHEVEYVEAAQKLIAKSEKRFKHVFTKLHAFGCTDYHRVILLDLDLLITDNVDELKDFKAPAALRRGHKELPPGVEIGLSFFNKSGQQQYGMNLGVAVLQPCQQELEKMLESVRSERDPMHQATTGPEQDFLTRWFRSKWNALDVKYNYQLHQMHYALGHEGAGADRLTRDLGSIKVLHFSGGVKPWDFFFDSADRSFEEFCSATLIPAYCRAEGASIDVLEDRLLIAAVMWHEDCQAMWRDLLKELVAGPACRACGEAFVDEELLVRLHHTFFECPTVADLDYVPWTEDINNPLPVELADLVSFIGTVMERRRWLQTPAEPLRSAPQEAMSSGTAEARDSAASNVGIGTLDARHMEGDCTPESPNEAPPARAEKTRTLHLVLYPAPLDARSSAETSEATQALEVPKAPQRPRDTGSVLDQVRDEILSQVDSERVTVIVAPTGCGKSTGIPQMILDAVDSDVDRRILCTQPRRVAATSLARRVAALRGEAPGGEVGFQIGGCSEVSRSGRTRLVFAVTAIAMIQCLQETTTFTHLIIDEVHIRDSFIDFLLTLVVTRVLKRNPRVKIVLMSAAMDSATITNFFAKALNGHVPKLMDLDRCRPHPLTIKYLDDFDFFTRKGYRRERPDGMWEVMGVPAEWNQEEVADLYAEFISELHRKRPPRKDGQLESFLVFLPGKREVSLLAEKLDDRNLEAVGVPQLDIKCVFGGQTVESQEKALVKSAIGASRTIILGTDVIESSVTIPDVDLVIDSCEHKRLRWDPSKKQSLLTMLLISQDEAKQRAGRTGRLRPGIVIRMISCRCYDRLAPHVEPQIKHSRLEDVLLTIFELPNLGDPREFLKQMPDAPDPLRVETAITRLLELKALDKAAAVEGGANAKPTWFGRFLQKMPLDPEVGLLVMNGVRLRLVKECAILAAVHQRGDPFLDHLDFSPQEVRSLREVRDACSPGRGSGARPLPGDLMAGLGAYRAWQAYLARSGSWSSVEHEAHWCQQHFLSLDRLHEIEEMVTQIHDVLEEMGYAPGLTPQEKERMRRRRQEKLSVKVERSHPAKFPGEDIRKLLGSEPMHRDTELLLAWCIAASFTAGILEITNGSSTEQLKYRSKRNRQDLILPYLRQCGFRVQNHRILKKGDVEITFSSTEEAHRAYQEAALVNNNFVPFQGADSWGRPNARTTIQPRKCYEDAPVRIVNSSLVQLPPTEDATVVAAEVLPCMDQKRKSMSYFCTKCSVVPTGILPLVLCATYPPVRVDKQTPGIWKVSFQVHGHKEEREYRAPGEKVEDLLDRIRKQLDTEFGSTHEARHRVVEERRKAILELLTLLDSPQPPPMERLSNPLCFRQGTRPRRGGFDAFGLDLDMAFLQALGETDFGAFSLDD